MIAPNKQRMLERFLASLPPAAAARLAQAVEVDRLNDGTALPHDLILDGLRPALRQQHTPRTLTPVRLFSRPFEDLLVSAPRQQKLPARISRDAVEAVWSWLEGSLAPELTRGYAHAVKEAVLSHQPEAALASAAAFWPAAAAALLKALSDEAKREEARRVLGGDMILADAIEMARLVAVGSEIVEIQAVLRKPVPALDDSRLTELREIYERIVAKGSDAAPLIAVIVKNRLERPWEALKLPLAVARQTSDTLISSTDMGLVGEIIFSEIEDRVAAIRAARPGQFDGAALAREVAAFAELSMGIVKGVEMRRDGKWGQRLMKARAAVAEIMEGLVEKSPREILAALPMQRASFTGGPSVPDLSHMPDAERAARANAFARLVVGCRPVAVAASFGAALNDASDELVATLGRYNDEILNELRGAEGDRRAIAQAHFEVAAELTAILMSPEEGELLRRRGRAAMERAA